MFLKVSLLSFFVSLSRNVIVNIVLAYCISSAVVLSVPDDFKY